MRSPHCRRGLLPLKNIQEFLIALNLLASEVGASAKPSTCYLFSSPYGDDPSFPNFGLDILGEAAKRRLFPGPFKILKNHNKELKARGFLKAVNEIAGGFS